MTQSEIAGGRERIDETGFGHIRIIQDMDGFCYGIDAVLIADFVTVPKGGRVADLGSGTGIIPLILSHKTQAGEIVGIEIQERMAKLGERNVMLNGLENRVSILHMDVKEAAERCMRASFDTVVSNPPYTAAGKGLTSAMDSKALARHEITADLGDFVAAAAAMLKDRGEFVLAHRPARLADVVTTCRAYRLEPKEIRFVYPREGAKEPNIMLLRCKKHGGAELKYLPPLYVHKAQGGYTDEILNIYER